MVVVEDQEPERDSKKLSFLEKIDDTAEVKVEMTSYQN